MGLGVWAIVLQSIVYSLVALLLVWWQGKLQFSMFFSKNSFKSIFIFSRHLLIANIYSSIVNELFSVIIGKFFAKQSVGYYVQSRRLTDSVSNSLAAINNQVFLPMLSSNREEDIKFLGLFRAAVTSVAFVSAPMMVLIMILSEPFVIVFLGEKWIDAVPILRYLSLSRVLLPLSAVNMMVFNAMGRSDLYLKVDMAKLPLLLIILIITIPQGLISMVQGLALAVLLSYTLEAIILGRILKFGLFVQLRDTLSIYIITFMMGAIVYVVIGLLESGVWKICLGSLSGLVSYVVLSWVFQKRSIERIKCLWE